MQSSSHTVTNYKQRLIFLLLNMHSFIRFLFFPGEPGLANFIEAKDDGSGGDN